MSLWTCTGCSTAYAVGLPRCPHCEATGHVEEGTDMPKITVLGGPSSQYDPEATEQPSTDSSPAAPPEPEAEAVEKPTPARKTRSRS